MAWPLLRSPGRAVPAMLLAAPIVLVTSGSPAQAVLTDLITGSRAGRVPVPLLPPLAAAGLLTAGALAGACALTTRRSA
ncbi:hypothetical protein [Streptomyces sp. NBC_00038]|uniref:hypothetical protein n=1 Tax=Streptomyces sp. NBC_00038 TaxID=2903615 RepID=UPI0022540958|nr:hypothetical protein [Streptomyces sp. NBC_00038]MCX5561484.1 hypothetical protein [Streptomyces sp. NBC_00038]